MKILSLKTAGNILIAMMALLLLFHILLMLGFIPYQIIWGGQIKETSSLRPMELIALLITLFFLLIVTMKLGYIRMIIDKKTVSVMLWIIFAYFVLNSLANLASPVLLEKILFAPVSILMALLTLRLAVDRQ